MISLQRAGVEKLTLAVCLHPELGFAAVLLTAPIALSCLVPRAAAGVRHTPGRNSWFPTVFCVQSVPLVSEICHLSTAAQIFALLI